MKLWEIEIKKEEGKELIISEIPSQMCLQDFIKCLWQKFLQKYLTNSSR